MTRHHARPRARERLRSLALMALLLAVALLWGASAARGAAGPTIRLFPSTVLEDIRETGYVAEEMETGLQDVIARLDQQRHLYLESKCDGAEGDPGCAQLARQLGATYLEMLQVMEERLPDMERAVSNTRKGLEKRLRSELGKKMSSWTLQEALLGNAPDGTTARSSQLRMRGRSGMRLSARFKQYYDLVAHSGSRSGDSMAVVASDIYLDMREAQELIARTREEISRATLMEQLNQSFGSITPEMQEVVGGVKSILFGDVAGPAEVPGPPPGSIEQAYRSPLEF